MPRAWETCDRSPKDRFEESLKKLKKEAREKEAREKKAREKEAQQQVMQVGGAQVWIIIVQSCKSTLRSRCRIAQAQAHEG